MGGKNQLRILCDIDGVLAGFNAGYAKVINRLTEGTYALPENNDYEPSEWHWPSALFGVPKSIEDQAWDHIHASKTFWESLEPLPLARKAVKLLNALAIDGHEVYFITARSGVDVKNQTERWLWNIGMNGPTVITTDAFKMPLAKMLTIDIIVEDHPKMAEAYAQDKQGMHFALIKREWNKAWWSKIDNCYDNAYDAINMETWKHYHTGKLSKLEVA